MSYGKTAHTVTCRGRIRCAALNLVDRYKLLYVNALLNRIVKSHAHENIPDPVSGTVETVIQPASGQDTLTGIQFTAL